MITIKELLDHLNSHLEASIYIQLNVGHNHILNKIDKFVYEAMLLNADDQYTKVAAYISEDNNIIIQ